MHVDNTTLCDLAPRMGEAEISRDTAFFEALLAEKLTFSRASGMVVDKATFFKHLRNPANTYDTLELEDVLATVDEGVAAVTVLVRAPTACARAPRSQACFSQHPHLRA